MATRSMTPRNPFSEPIGNCSATTSRPKTSVSESSERSKLESSRSIQVSTNARGMRSEEHTSELQSRLHLVCRLLLEKKKETTNVRIEIYSITVTARTDP